MWARPRLNTSLQGLHKYLIISGEFWCGMFCSIDPFFNSFWLGHHFTCDGIKVSSSGLKAVKPKMGATEFPKSGSATDANGLVWRSSSADRALLEGFALPLVRFPASFLPISKPLSVQKRLSGLFSCYVNVWQLLFNSWPLDVFGWHDRGKNNKKASNFVTPP